MGKKLILKNVRFSYVRVFEPQQFQGVGEFKYSVVVLIPKTDTEQLRKIRETIAPETQGNEAGSMERPIAGRRQIR